MNRCRLIHGKIVAIHREFRGSSASVRHKLFNFCNLLFTYKLYLLKLIEALIKDSREKLAILHIARAKVYVKIPALINRKMTAAREQVNKLFFSCL